MADLLVKPIARGEGRATVDGAALTTAERAELAARIEAEPHAWVGQEPQRQSTAPVVAADGTLDARPLVLRTFAVAAGGAFRVLAGGLAEAGTRGDTVAKDVWVSGRDRPRPPRVDRARRAPRPPLSPRVAADLFWLGRYAERAEGTARLLRAVADRFADFRSTPEPAGGRGPRRAAAGRHRRHRPRPRAPRLHALITDRDLPGTLAYAVHRLTGAAQAVREQLSTDTWLVLGRLESVLAEVAAAGPTARDASGALSRVLEGLLALAGLAAESHVRDAGWHLTDAGERRGAGAARRRAGRRHPAASRGCPPPTALVLESVLIAAESLITYRRRPRTGLDAVLELLITDPDNPRSIGYQADRLRQDVAHVPGPDGGVLGRARGRRAAAGGAAARRPRPPRPGRHPRPAAAARSSGSAPTSPGSPTCWKAPGSRPGAPLATAGARRASAVAREPHLPDHPPHHLRLRRRRRRELRPRPPPAPRPAGPDLPGRAGHRHARGPPSCASTPTGSATAPPTSPSRSSHRRLEVLAESTVAVDERPAPASTPPWEAVRDRLRGRHRPAAPGRPGVHAAVAAAAGARRGRRVRAGVVPGRGGRSREAAVDLCGRIHRDFRYVSGSSTVGSTVPELLARGAGVCQDFAHLAVAGLRAMGLAARYVSGYLETTPPPGGRGWSARTPRTRGCRCAPGAGWVDLDPTNDQLVDASYVELAHGRDYGDVPPLKGVIFADSHGEA